MKNEIPKGLIFSRNSPSRKKRIKILIPILILIQVCVIWPIYPIMSGWDNLMLGLPISFLWVILMVCCSFISMLIFFRKDNEEEM